MRALRAGGRLVRRAAAAGCLCMSACAALAGTLEAGAADHPDTAEAWLARLEADAQRLGTLEARVRVTSVQALLDDKTIRFGDLAYAAGLDAGGGNDEARPARFAVRFDRILLDGQLQEADQAYVFDGRWLLERNSREKTATRRELAAADAAGLMQGEGPFPIPLNLNKQRVMERFSVELMPPAEDDPPTEGEADAGTVHLRLTPRETVEVDAERVDLWFDRATGQPRRAASLQEDGDATIIDLFEREADAAIDAAAFDTTLPAGDGWDTQTVPLQ